jgi:diguanylate cyclase (GGDEF)-like protein/PAS domain S-box-containing protein
MMAIIETGETRKFVRPVPRPDGTLTSTAVPRAAWVIDDFATGYVDTVLDVTQRHEAALRESEARYRMIVETSREGVWLIDLAGVTTFVNERLAEMLGYQIGEMIGRPLCDFLDDEVKQVAEASLIRQHDGVDVRFEFRFIRRNGTSLWALISASAIHDAGGTHIGALAMLTDITLSKIAEADLAHSATHDGLTGLPNRILLVHRLDTAVARSVRNDTHVAVLCFGLDRFKGVNDSLGRDAGDRVLVAIAGRLRTAIQPGDTVARVGGDQFAVCCEGLGEATEAGKIAARLGLLLATPVVVEGHEVFVTASIGIRVVGHTTEPAGDLLRDADDAMYQAKRSGRACHSEFDASLRGETTSRLAIESDLHHALDRGELRIHYQPTVSIIDGTMAGVEALVRWEHPEKGMLPPADFIGIAEETGLIVPIGLWVLDHACEQLHLWNQARAVPLTMAVNLSPRQLLSPELVSQVGDILGRHRVDPGHLCLEITETVLMEDARAEGVLSALKALGVQLALDDFGTGYSSLGYLSRFPVDVLKVDRSFIANLGSDHDATTIVASIVRLAQALRLQIVAEGVETQEQLTQLALLGCELGQGFYWSLAVAPDQLDQWLNPIVSPTMSPAEGVDGQMAVELAGALRGG